MNINNTGYNNQNQTVYNATQNDAAAQAVQNNTPANNTTAPTQTERPSVQVASRVEQSSQNTMFLLERMFGDQAGVARRANDLFGETFVPGSIAEYLSTLTPEQAQDYIAEDGFWGVERTAERLFDMAYALAGGNEVQMERMRDAVISGFEAAGRAWGSDLPDISQETLDRTMEMFDTWFEGR